jgi:hypothetical protein
MIALFLLLQVAPVSRTYWPATVAQLASGTFRHTHVQVSGIVVYTRLESDGDLHAKLVTDSAAVHDSLAPFIVAEIIPAIPLARPPTGKRITVYGIQRFDPEHGWRECHPVERWVLAP